jgi:hypothetical protein
MPAQYLSRSRRKLPSWSPEKDRGPLPLLLALFLVLPLLVLFPRRLSGGLAGPYEGGAV